ncbi:MAG: hypothetical protein AAGD23_12120 [Pseudomonadota bacterium]
MKRVRSRPAPSFSVYIIVFVVLLPMCLAIAACASVPLRSMPSLARIDFPTTDLAALRVAVSLPTELQPLDKEMRLTAQVKLGDSVPETETFELERVLGAAEEALIAQRLQLGQRLHAYRVSSDDVQRLVLFRDRAVERKESSGQQNASLSIGISPKVCAKRSLDNTRLPFTTYLKTSETGSYVQLTRSMDIRQIDETSDLINAIQPCEATYL